MPSLSFEDQVAQLVSLLGALGSTGTPKQLADLLKICAGIPVRFFPIDFPELLARTFNVDVDEMRKCFPSPTAIVLGGDFDPLVPTRGWLNEYIEYTKNTEPPTVFHFFSAISVLGATIARRVCFPRGSGDIFPNINAVLVAPPGKCKKTTAANIAVNLFRRIGGNVLADRVTPEALIESFKTTTTATGLIYAPEWAVFLGRQQYMEGLVPMLTALFDCPQSWSSSTIMRSTTQLQNVAISHLACSTIDWMQTSVTRDAFNGGFMSRLLFIVQQDTPRRFPFPPPLNQALAKRLVDHLLQVQQTVGQVTFDPAARVWYETWYMSRTANALERQFAGYLERKPDRMIQMAMILNAAEDPRSLTITVVHLEQAERILNWIEKLLPAAFSELAATTTGDDQQRLLKQIRHADGMLTHAEWIRLNRSRIGADQFKKLVETLRQGGMVAQDPVTKIYYLLTPGWQTE